MTCSHRPFAPSRHANQKVTSTNTSASITVDQLSMSLRIVNSGSNIAHVRTSAVATSATEADLPVLPGTSIVIHKGTMDSIVAHISPSGTTLHIQTGEGGL